jgi:hypothetical protein
LADQEIGVYGTLTQGEIADARDGPGKGSDQETRRGDVSMDDVRAYAKELSQAEDRAREQAMEQAQQRDRGGHEM